MQVQMNAVLLGAKKVDFEQHKFVSLYAQVRVKNGDGYMTEKFKFLKGFDNYEAVQGMLGKQVELTGGFESNGREQFFVVDAIRPIANAQQSPVEKPSVAKAS